MQEALNSISPTYGSKSSSVSNNLTVDNLNSPNSGGISHESLDEQIQKEEEIQKIEEIQKLQDECIRFLSQKLQEPIVSIDSYRLGGKLTYYYQNISQFPLTFSGIPDPDNFTLMPGDIIDLGYYFETEEEILKNLELKKYEKILTFSPYLRTYFFSIYLKRLTPGEFFQLLKSA